MALAGYEVWKTQLFLRWGSSAVMCYVREAPLAASTQFSRMATRSISVQALVNTAIIQSTALGRDVAEG
eukprot:4840998-Alexandrium_andersonii.AAC.1